MLKLFGLMIAGALGRTRSTCNSRLVYFCIGDGIAFPCPWAWGPSMAYGGNSGPTSGCMNQLESLASSLPVKSVFMAASFSSLCYAGLGGATLFVVSRAPVSTTGFFDS